MKNKITIPKCSTDHQGLNDNNIMQVQKELEILLLLLQKKGRKMTSNYFKELMKVTC